MTDTQVLPDPTTQESPRRQLRVVQWATGNIGSAALRAVIEHPALELVGLFAHGPNKIGRDAGDIAGVAATGVTATGDIEEIVALGADCVLYMPLLLDADVVTRLLESGANVVTTRGEFHRPASMEPELRARIEAACAAGGSSIHSTGISPGFISEALPLVLSSVQRRIDRISINEYADVSSRDSPEMLFGVMGFGTQPGANPQADQGRAEYLRLAFGPSLELLADALSLPLDSTEAKGEVAVVRSDTTIAAGVLAAGTVGAQRTTISGIRDGKTLLSFTATWYATDNVEGDWDLLSNGWRVSVEGDAPLDLDIRMPIPVEKMAETTPGYTANRAVNAVTAVVDAAPGIRTTLELPQIVAALG